MKNFHRGRGNLFGASEYEVLNQPRCRVWKSANFAFGPAGDTAITTFDKTDYDTDGMATFAASQGRVYCRTAGLYIVQFSVFYSGAGTFETKVKVNGLAFRHGEALVTNVGLIPQVALIPLNAGDYMQVIINSTGALTMGAGQDVMYLAACLISTI